MLSKTYKLVIITSRPKKKEKDTKEWVKKHFKEIEEIYFARKYDSENSLSKADICKHIGADLLIEDHPRYAKECLDIGIKVLLFDYPYNVVLRNSNLLRRVNS